MDSQTDTKFNRVKLSKSPGNFVTHVALTVYILLQAEAWKWVTIIYIFLEFSHVSMLGHYQIKPQYLTNDQGLDSMSKWLNPEGRGLDFGIIYHFLKLHHIAWEYYTGGKSWWAVASIQWNSRSGNKLAWTPLSTKKKKRR